MGEPDRYIEQAGSLGRQRYPEPPAIARRTLADVYGHIKNLSP
jgi:hypothetical protein